MGHRARKEEEEEEMIWQILHWAGVIVAIYISYKAIDCLARD